MAGSADLSVHASWGRLPGQRVSRSGHVSGASPLRDVQSLLWVQAAGITAGSCTAGACDIL